MKSFLKKIGHFVKQNCLLLALILTALSVSIVGLCIVGETGHPVEALVDVIRRGDHEDDSPTGDDTEPLIDSSAVTTDDRPAVSDTETQPVTDPATPPDTTSVEPDINPTSDGGEEYFRDALFIGDSRTHGLYLYGNIDGASYFAKTSMSVFNCLKTTGAQTGQASDVDLPAYLSSHQFKKIYILLGINEIGSNISAIASQYSEIIGEIQQWQPNAIIIIQSNTNVTAKKSAANKSTFNNDRLNDLNRKLSDLADGERIFYLDIAHLFNDENGALKPEYTGDGVHLKGKYYGIWRDFLLQNGRF